MTLTPKSRLARLAGAADHVVARAGWRARIASLAALLAIAGVVAASAWYLSPLRGDDPTSASGGLRAPASLQEGDVLYLVAPEDRDEAPLAGSEFGALGVSTVDSVQALKAAAAAGPVAILIDRSYLDRLTESDVDFLAGQFGAGVIAGGTQVSGLELAHTLGVDDELAALDVDLQQMFQYTPGRSFYSLIYDIEVSGAQCSGASSDYLDRGREADNVGLKQMMDRIARLSDCPRGEDAEIPS